MSTERLFEGPPLTRVDDARFEATVTAVERRAEGVALELDRSLFYPTGGGQPCDLGTLDGLAVRDVLEEGERQLHLVADEGAAKWEVGRPVVGAVDLPRRRDHMQQHSGQHLLSAVLVREHGVATVSFHLGRELCTIDVVADAVAPAVLRDAEARCNAAIQACLPVSVELHQGAAVEDAAQTLRKRPDAKALASERGLRVVQLGDPSAPLDREACCGTHVGNLGQLGSLVILGSERGRKGHTRIQFAVGERAVAAIRARLDALDEVCLALNTGPADAGERARGLVAQVSEQAKALKRLEQDAARAEATRLAAEGSPWRVHTLAVAGPKALTTFAQTYVSAHPGGSLVLLHAAERTSLVVRRGDAAPEAFDAAQLLRELLEPHHGKGGGSRDFAQGTAPSAAAAAALAAAAEARLGELFG